MRYSLKFIVNGKLSQKELLCNDSESRTRCGDRTVSGCSAICRTGGFFQDVSHKRGYIPVISYGILMACVLFLLPIFSAYGAPPHSDAALQMTNRIDILEQNAEQYINKIESLNKRIEKLEEAQQYSWTFNNHRIGMVGVILSLMGLILAFAGLVVAIFVAFESHKARQALKDAREVLNEINGLKKQIQSVSKDAEDKANQIIEKLKTKIDTVSKDINAFYSFLDESKLNITDVISMAFLRFSEDKSARREVLHANLKTLSLEDFKKFYCQILKEEKALFYKAQHWLDLLNRMEDGKVWAALNYFYGEGDLKDVVFIKKAMDSGMSEKNRDHADVVIRKLSKNYL